MQMKRALAVILWSLISLAGLANANSIPIGELSYLGTTPDGSSIFKVSLNPPAGISLTNLIPSIYIGDDKFTFALPTSGDFLFLTGPGTPFANCPCTDAHIDFLASPGTTVTFEGKTLTLKHLSHSFLQPATGQKFLVPGQSATIYLSTAKGQTTDAVRLTTVPEPQSLALVGSGLGMILLKIRERLRL
jgi:hypothetical protein